MKKLLLMVFTCALALGLYAQNAMRSNVQSSFSERQTHITDAQALDVGFLFMRTNGHGRGNVSKQSMQLVYTGTAIDGSECYYVFSLQPRGFVIVAADERAEPILGYSYDNPFSVDGMPDNVRYWLNHYVQQIKAAVDDGDQPSAEIAERWTLLRSGQTMPTRSVTAVSPLIQTTWDQNQYYNQFCPADANGPGGHVYAGCVATAMAQIIRYWQWPNQGFNSHSYVHNNYGTLSVDYNAATYNYSNMPNSLNSSSSSTQVAEVAKLIYHCGVAVDMDYTVGGSSAYFYPVVSALNNYFAFKDNGTYVFKSNYSDTEWSNMLKQELDNARPIFYSGQGTGGHAFICDGYDNNGNFHFNWGWSGSYNDGYYALDALTPGAHSYSNDQEAIIGISVTGSFIRCSTSQMVLNVSGNGESEPQTLSVRGRSLSGNINVTVGGGFKISTNGTNYSTSATLASTGGTLYVKYIPTSSNTTEYTMTLTSGSCSASVTLYGSTLTEPCVAPKNLVGTRNGTSVNLQWSEPVTYGNGSPASAVLSWDTNSAISSYYGYQVLSQCMAQRFESSDLTPYNQYLLKSVSFIGSPYATSYSVVVFKGGSYSDGSFNSGEQVVNQVVPMSTVNTNGWNTVFLNNAVLVDASSELWFGVVATGDYVIPYIEDEAVPNKGNVLGFTFDEGDTEFYWNNFYSSNIPLKGTVEKMSAHVLHYDVYRQNTLIGSTSNMSYTDNSPLNISCPYSVSAVWNNGCSESATVMVSAPAYTLPTVTTNIVSDIGVDIATCGGNVTSDGGATVTGRGVCWSTSPNPTVSNNHTTDGSGTGSFTSGMTGLTPNTTYYVRAYATNSVGTAYGAEASFTTVSGIPAEDGQPCPNHETVTDYSGNVYNTVKIGEQCWMRENLRVKYYEDGVEITTGTSYSVNAPYCFYPNNDINSVSTYGYLYNWYAIMHGVTGSSANLGNVQGVCPAGWHIPSNAEWNQLFEYVSSIPGYVCHMDDDCDAHIAKALASAEGWAVCDDECTVGNNQITNNVTGFSAIPIGGGSASFWSSEENAACVFLYNFGENVWHGNNNKNGKYSVRCVLGTGYDLFVNTNTVSSVTQTSALSGGNVTYSGNTPITARGVCWSTSQNPTVNDNHTTESLSMNSFTSTLTGLTPNTTYYVRAYVTNGSIMCYGEQRMFTTSCNTVNVNIAGPTIIDYGQSTTLTASGANSYVWNNGDTGYSITVSPSFTTTYCVTGSNQYGCTDTAVVTVWVTNSNLPEGDGFPCSGYETVTDIDGNVYNTVKIGQQCWMKENLRVEHYADGTEIALSSTTNASIPHRYYPNNNADYVHSYGYLYNWPAVLRGNSPSSTNPSNVQGVCPTGWHVPSNAEWTQLSDYVSSQNVYTCGNDSSNIAKAMAANLGWLAHGGDCEVGNNQFQNNATGFSALPAGGFNNGNYFYYGVFGETAAFWSSSSIDHSNDPFLCVISYASNNLLYSVSYPSDRGFSVRCVFDNITVNVSIEGNTTIDYGQSTTLTASGANYYSWSTGSTEASITVSPTSTTTYTVTGSNNYGNADTVSVTVIVNSIAPVVTTGNCVSYGTTYVNFNGNVISDGGATVTARGICWNNTGMPTISDAHTTEGSGTGRFISTITGLSPNTTYYVRAYATNSMGTSYGNQIDFTTESQTTIEGLFSGLVAYYPFDNDDLTDHSGNSNNGTNHGTTLTSDRFCSEGNARNFSGVNNSQYIEVPNNSTLQFTDAATVSMWFCMNGKRGMNGYGSSTETGNNHYLFAKLWDSQQNMRARVTVLDNGMFLLASEISQSCAEDTIPELQIGQWAQATFVYTTTYIETYLNGQLIARTDASNSFSSSNGRDLRFGKMGGSWYPLNGKLDDIRIFNRALSADEVAQLYNIDIVPKDSLLVLLPLDGNVTDYSGNGFAPVIHGNLTPSVGHHGIDNTAFYFPGEAGSWIEIPHDDRLSLCGSFTVSAWYNRDADCTEGNIIGKGRDIYQGWKLHTGNINVNGAASYQYHGSETSAATINSELWYMTTGVYDSATHTLRHYLNGELVDEVYDCNVPLPTNFPVAIGRHLYSESAGNSTIWAYPFKGEIDDIVIYNRPLSIDEIQILYSYNPHVTGCIIETPTVVTNEVTNVAYSAATCGGNVTATGGANVTARGVCWSTSQNPTVSDSHTTNGSGTGSFTSNITGLIPNTTYYLRAYATNSVGTSYGAQKMFTTSCNTVNVSIAGATTISYGGNTTLTASGANSYSWSTGGNNASITVSPAATTTYTVSGTNSYGCVGTASVMVTVTCQSPTVTTKSITDITTTSAKSGGNVTSDGGTPVTARGVCWSTSQNPTVSGNHTTNGSGTGSFTNSMTGLAPNTTYYVRAYATNGVGTAYGNEVAFTTNSCSDITFPYTENFDGYTTSTTTATGVEPTCWELVHPDVPMTNANRPQLCYNNNFAHSGDYSLKLYYRGVYAMPELELEEGMSISQVKLEMYLRQANAKYQLQVGIWEESGTFVPVATFNNSSTEVEYVTCDFSGYRGRGGRIAFRNTLGSGTTVFSSNYIDDITLTNNCEPISLPYTENFDNYTTVTATETGVEPDCWEVVTEDVALTNATRPQLYRGFSTSGDYSLRLKNRCVYAMPEFAEDVNVKELTMTFKLRQASAVYRLQVGVVEANGAFTVVKTINNATSDMEDVVVKFSGYTGSGKRIAFRNTVKSSSTLAYSTNYIDDIVLGYTCDIVELPYTENFDSYTTVTATETGVEPDCWEVVTEDVALTNATKPQLYRGFSTSGDYSLRLKNRCVYAMPALGEGIDIKGLEMSFKLRQASAVYRLQVGVVEENGSFTVVKTINNATANMEDVVVKFSGYTGSGKRIAFRNTVKSGSTLAYSTNYIDDIVLDYTCDIVELPYTEDFDSYTTVTATETGVEPDCWEVVTEDVALTNATKPQLYRGFSTSGDYSLRLKNRCVYAMPEFAEGVNVKELTMTFKLRQANAVYRLQVGVVEENGAFTAVKTINNATAEMEDVTVSFSGYTGSGRRIAFRNTLKSSSTLAYSTNYIDDINITRTATAKSAEVTDANAGMLGAERDKLDVVVYPNPTTDVVNVQCSMDNVQCSGIEVVDIYGKIITTVGTRFIASDQTPVQINVSGLAAGMYFVRVTTDRGVVTKPFVKR